MKRVPLLALCAAGTLLASSLLAAELKSGPQAGTEIPGVFHPLNVTGPYAGQKQCLV